MSKNEANQTPGEPEKANAKTYGLKPIETTMLNVMTKNHLNNLANLLSMIAVERLAYPADELTQYEIAPDGKSVKIWQKTPEPVVGDQQPAPANDNKTADALGGNK